MSSDTKRVSLRRSESKSSWLTQQNLVKNALQVSCGLHKESPSAEPTWAAGLHQENGDRSSHMLPAQWGETAGLWWGRGECLISSCLVSALFEMASLFPLRENGKNQCGGGLELFGQLQLEGVWKFSSE